MPRPVTQINMFERTVEDADLEAALEEREAQKEVQKQAAAAFREKHERASTLIGGLDLSDDMPVRVGRFVITQKRTKGRSVSFETNPGRRLQISLLDQGGEES